MSSIQPSSGSNYNPFRTENDKPTSSEEITGMGKLSGDYGKTGNWFFRKVYDSVSALFTGKYWKGGWFAPKQSGDISGANSFEGRLSSVSSTKSDSTLQGGVAMDGNQFNSAVDNASQVVLHPNHASPEPRDGSTNSKTTGMIAELKFSSELNEHLQGLSSEATNRLKGLMVKYALINEKRTSASHEDLVIKKELGKDLRDNGISYNIGTGMFQKTTEGLPSTVRSAAQAIDEGVMATADGRAHLQEAALQRGESFVEPQANRQPGDRPLPGSIASNRPKI